MPASCIRSDRTQAAIGFACQGKDIFGRDQRHRIHRDFLAAIHQKAPNKGPIRDGIERAKGCLDLPVGPGHPQEPRGSSQAVHLGIAMPKQNTCQIRSASNQLSKTSPGSLDQPSPQFSIHGPFPSSAPVTGIPVREPGRQNQQSLVLNPLPRIAAVEDFCNQNTYDSLPDLLDHFFGGARHINRDLVAGSRKIPTSVIVIFFSVQIALKQIVGALIQNHLIGVLGLHIQLLFKACS